MAAQDQDGRMPASPAPGSRPASRDRAAGASRPSGVDPVAQEHTAGPWAIGSISIDTGSIGITQPKQRIVIADVHNAASFGDFVTAAMRNPGRFGSNDDAHTQWANARLISAAPDLLAALRLLHDNLAEYQRINNLGGYDNQDMQIALAAIAKAEGR